MTGEAERKDANLPVPACGPATGPMKVAQIGVFAILVTLTIVAFPAAAGLLPAGGGTVLTVLFWFWLLSAAINTAQLLARAAVPHEQRSVSCDKSHDWPRTMYVLRLLWRGLLIVLLVCGHYGLAALSAYGIALGIASRVENRLILGETKAVGLVSRAVHALVYAVAEQLAPVCAPLHRLLMRPTGGVPLFIWFILLPFTPLFILFAAGWLLYWLLRGLIAIPFLLFDWRRERSDRRDLVKASSANGIVAWFAYAEPHQREHFMGEGGVLHGLGDAVIVRDWRGELGEAWRTGSLLGLDALIVRQFKLSNMRDDLTVIVLLQPDGRLYPIRMNRAYRQRRRDGGDLLGTMEETIRERIGESRQVPA